MSSQYTSQNSENAGNVQTVVNSMINKEHQYRVGISTNASMANSVALRLVKGKAIDKYLSEFSEEGEDDPLMEQRQRLKQLTQKNIERDEQITIFLKSLQDIGNQCHNENTENYQQELQDRMKQKMDDRNKSKRRRKSSANDYMKHPMYQELCQKLGEEAAVKGDDDEDEELMVMNTGESNTDLKCPLTGTMLEDPVKNSVCGHIFSKAALQNHLRVSNRKQCPMPGCINTNITMSQFEVDRETAILIRREKHKQESQNRPNQGALDLDRDDDDDDEGEEEFHDGNTQTQPKDE
mmetsp:Transcript_12010/g.34709  ORF Transcript_12010/g.34709 Transcript_12010/m.34709 type:complete len:294 (+) Transcript_12010:109-990(+)|eukprot:CAMPEP_0119560138 /NCGR_PEP_ID=MMETSP1352-20130426/14125_1 /TAXON_ID=265584 /ORGANISM="Stauroneis constricta, Strain CCMP1120" /LENGTH=293 /DNA_ID=CAMNT_0007608049 /DNA_START=95 /DNA_END=976 /DNA_ORIENTATION=+